MPQDKPLTPLDIERVFEALGVDDLAVELTIFRNGEEQTVVYRFIDGKLVAEQSEPKVQ